MRRPSSSHSVATQRHLCQTRERPRKGENVTHVDQKSPDIEAIVRRHAGIPWRYPKQVKPLSLESCSGADSVHVNCFVLLAEAIQYEQCGHESGEPYSFVYNTYVPGGGMVLMHLLNPDTPLTDILRLAALDYATIDEHRGLELHPFSDLSIEQVNVDHKARTVTFFIGS